LGLPPSYDALLTPFRDEPSQLRNSQQENSYQEDQAKYKDRVVIGISKHHFLVEFSNTSDNFISRLLLCNELNLGCNACSWTRFCLYCGCVCWRCSKWLLDGLSGYITESRLLLFDAVTRLQQIKDLVVSVASLDISLWLAQLLESFPLQWVVLSHITLH